MVSEREEGLSRTVSLLVRESVVALQLGQCL